MIASLLFASMPMQIADVEHDLYCIQRRLISVVASDDRYHAMVLPA